MYLCLLILLFVNVHSFEFNHLHCATVVNKTVASFYSSHVVSIQPNAKEMFVCTVWIPKQNCDSNVTLNWTGLNENFKVWDMDTKEINNMVFCFI
jgi:hypothetical protein